MMFWIGLIYAIVAILYGVGVTIWGIVDFSESGSVLIPSGLSCVVTGVIVGLMTWDD